MEARLISTEQNLLDLIGVPESFRLEFKSARLLRNKEKVMPELSKTISAFANSEGGTLIIGIAETVIEGNRRVAKELDGIERELVSPEWLGQVIRLNISPALPGIRLHEITLTAHRAGRVAFVVIVPSGSTAYQASDRRYYGRQEFGVEPLPDHEVRLRMARGRISRLHFEADDPCVVTADQEYAERQEQLARYRAQISDDLEFLSSDELDRLKAPQRNFDEYSLQLVVQNVGEVTIRDFMLVLEWVLPPEAILMELATRFRFDTGKTRMVVHGGTEYDPPANKLFPDERTTFPKTRLAFRLPESCGLADVRMLLRWTAFLDDAPPSKGEINVGAWFSQQGQGRDTNYASS